MRNGVAFIGLAVGISMAWGMPPQIQFAHEAVKSSLQARGATAKVEFEIDGAADLKPEGFMIRKDGDETITVIGKDAAGAMYGGLDLAETLRNEGLSAVQTKSQNPYMQMRGIKFNVPLDVRSPSYTDVSDAAQKNMPEVWSMDFWKEYIDTVAEYRYNYISLWSLQPFPSLVKVPEYPDVSLDDVMRSKGPFKEYYSLTGQDWTGPEFEEENLEVIKKFTIDEKIEFWRKVMAYGKTRNVDFYLITWNIFDYGIDGKYGINDEHDNETTIDYFRRSVREMILTYPDLAGIGITTGENMLSRELHSSGKRREHLSAEAKEDWMVKTYLAGTLDALKESPERRIRFIHRQHQAGTDMVLKKMQPLINHPNVDFIFSFKYAQAHVYSATEQPFHTGFVSAIRNKVKTIWTLRNDDIYLYRWGAPDFVREFIKNIPYEVSQGCYYGHDGFINGREFTQLDHETPRQLEVDKHWMQWMLWGRLAYNPDYSNERIRALLAARYPEVDSAKLFNAWQKASMVYPNVTGFHWGRFDFHWYIEGMRSQDSYAKRNGAKTDSGFHDTEVFLNYPTHDRAGVQSIPDFVAGKKTKDRSPLELADQIDADVEEAERLVNSLGDVKDKELRLTLDDIKIICEMGRYYADRIRGATYVAQARASKAQADKDEAIAFLTKAAEHYKTYVDRANNNHMTKVWFNRVGNLDLEAQIKDAEADIEIARQVVVD